MKNITDQDKPRKVTAGQDKPSTVTVKQTKPSKVTVEDEFLKKVLEQRKEEISRLKLELDEKDEQIEVVKNSVTSMVIDLYEAVTKLDIIHKLVEPVSISVDN